MCLNLEHQKLKKPQEVFRTLSRNQGGIIRMESREPDLEEIFVKLVKPDGSQYCFAKRYRDT